MDRIIMTASSISVSELKANRKYLSVSMRMFSTRPNLNKCAVTENFIDDIIANKNDYVCMGLFGDTKKLKSNDYKHGLTHLYDRKTGQFLADQIGAFYDFEKVEDEYGISLIGYARITKRSEAVCDAIERLYEEDSLNFSFEISAGVVEVIDGITIVDANPENELTGMAVVSVPAYPESKALDLVAENENIEKMFSTMLFISELEMETVKTWIWHWVYETFECYMRVLMFCMDCFIIYDEQCGKTYKVEYLIDGDNMIVKDFYEVNFTRSEGSEKMNTEMENKVAELEAEEVVVAEEEVVTVAEEISEPETEVIAETEVAEEVVAEEIEAEEIQVSEEVAEEQAAEEIAESENSELEEARRRCAEMEAEIAELRAFKAEIDRINAERAAAEEAARLQAEQDTIRAFAQKNGLDVNDQKIAELIAECDYKALVVEVTAVPAAKEEVNNDAYFAGYVSMAPKGSFGYLLERR